MGMLPENCFLKQLFIVKEQLLLSLNANTRPLVEHSLPRGVCYF